LKPGMNYFNGSYVAKVLNHRRFVLVRKVDSNIFGTFGANVAIMALGMLGGILMARALAPDGRGQVAAILVYAQLLSWIFNGGLAAGNLYYINKEPANKAIILTNALVYSLVTSLPSLAIGWVIVIYWLPEYEYWVRFSAILFFGLVPLSVATDYLISAQQALKKFGWFNGMRLGRQALQTTGIVVLFVFGWLTVPLTVVTVGAANSIVGFIVLGWYVKNYWKERRLDFAVFRRCFSFGLKSYLGTLTNTSGRHLDQLILVPIVTSAELGLYAVALSLSSAVMTIAQSVSAVVLPQVASRSRRSGKSYLIRSSKYTGAVLIVVSAALFGLAPYLIGLLYGEAFLSSVPLFHVLLIAGFFLGIGDLLTQGLNGLGRPVQGSLAEFVSIVINLTVLLLLVAKVGVIAAAVAAVVAYLIRFVILTYFIKTTVDDERGPNEENVS
jgi:O-antigen/teichoic acid export membrane protein